MVPSRVRVTAKNRSWTQRSSSSPVSLSQWDVTCMPEGAPKFAGAFILRALGHGRGDSALRYEWSEGQHCVMMEIRSMACRSLKNVLLPKRGARGAYHVQWL